MLEIPLLPKEQLILDIISHTNNDTSFGTYLGWQGAKSNATGFFRVEKDCDGVWNIIDPDGNMFYSAGLNSVEKGGGIALPSTLTNLGLNTLANWSDQTITGMPFCTRMSFLNQFKNTSPSIKSDFDNDIMPVFEPDFESFCTSFAITETAPYLNNKWLIGYFTDNELNFHKTQLVSSLALPTSNAQYKAADAWMKAKYGNSYATSGITAADELDYMGYVIETYYRIVYTALKAADPNHMSLGTRFHSSVKYTEQTFASIKNYVDIVSVNYYGSYEPEADYMDMWLTKSGKPFIISEFYVKGNDAGLTNADGAGWDVDTQNHRRDWFENWMTLLLQNKGSVGFHWFRYIDNNDSNKGLYSTSYTQYTKLADAFKTVCRSLYSFRSHVIYGNSNYNGVIDCNNVLCGSCTTLSTSISDFSAAENVILYPNPVSKLLHVQFDNSNPENKSIEVISLLGKIVKTVNINSNQNNIVIDTANLAEGIYIVRITNSNNETTSVNKIMISR